MKKLEKSHIIAIVAGFILVIVMNFVPANIFIILCAIEVVILVAVLKAAEQEVVYTKPKMLRYTLQIMAFYSSLGLCTILQFYDFSLFSKIIVVIIVIGVINAYVFFKYHKMAEKFGHGDDDNQPSSGSHDLQIQ